MFEEQAEPARALGMGNAVVAAGRDVSAVPFNPAILAGVERYSISGTYSSRWSLEGFTEYSSAISIPTPVANFALLWHERSVSGVYSERTASLAFARKIVGALDGGFTGKVFIAEAPGAELWADPAYKGAVYALCADVGLRYAHSERWKFAISTRSMGEPEIAMLETTDSPDSPGGQVAFGAEWMIVEDLILAGDIVSEEGNLHKWSPRAGMEVKFFDVLAVRAGAKGQRISMGAGIETDYWAFDVALTNHRWLGNIYRFTLTMQY